MTGPSSPEVRRFDASPLLEHFGPPLALVAQDGVYPFDFSDKALAARDDGSVRGFIRQTSLSVGLRYTRPRAPRYRPGPAEASVCIAYAHRYGTRPPMLSRCCSSMSGVPGLNVGLGTAVGPFRLKPVIDVGVRIVNLRGRPLVSLPIAVGLRF